MFSELTDPMGLPFHLRCLGRPQLISPSGEPVRFRVRKHLAMLVYLALEPRIPQRRERIADLLWPNVSPTDGRHSLATAVSVLRGKLGRELIEGDRDHVQLIGSHLTVDLERLAAGNILGDEYLPALDVGGFLDDFDIHDAPEYMIWLERQRARWLPSVRDALVLLIDRCRRTGDFRRIEQLGNSLLDIDELSEDGIRAKMEARAFDGDRVTALKIFQSWKVKLSSELDAVPSPLVEGIAIRLRQRGWEAVTVSNIPTVPTDQWKGRSFIGRAREYEALYNAWESTCKEAPHHVLVLGDSGVGKSTLIERAVTAAGLEGAGISRVQCYELEREIPYAAVSSLIEGMLLLPGASTTSPEWLAELARTVPQVRRRFPGIPEAIDSHGETARIRLTEAVQQLAMAIAEEHPVILVLDDVHLADDASLAVLHLMMRRTPTRRIMVLMAARLGELGQSPQSLRLTEHNDRTHFTVLDLPPMNGDDAATFLQTLLTAEQTQPTKSVQRALIRAAAGYPMVLEYLVKDWQDNGEVCIALSVDAMTQEVGAFTMKTHTYHLIMERISQQIEPHVRNVLTMAALLGPRLNDVDLYSIADVSVGQTISSLARLTDLRILRDGGQGLEFSNELIRAEAYLGVPSSIRRTLHRNIAESLVHLESTGKSIPGLEIAWHLIRGGRTDEATSYLLKGARQAMTRGAPLEAERGLSTAMGHLEEPAKTDALLLQAESLKEQGKWEAVLNVLGQCRFETIDERKRIASMLSMEPRRRLGLSNPEGAEALLNDILALAASSEHDTRIKIGAITTATYFLAQSRDDSLSATLRGMIASLPEEDLGDEQLANLATARALVDYHDRDISSAVSGLLRTSTALRRRGLHNLSIASMHMALANVESAAGEYDSAIEHCREAYQMADQLGNDPMCASVAANVTMCAARLGYYQQAIDWFNLAIAKDRELRSIAIFHCLYHAAIAQAMLGLDTDTNETIDKLASVATRIARDSFRQNVNLYLADCYLITGRRKEALTRARMALGLEPMGPLSPNSAGIYARWLAAVHHDAGLVDKTCPALQNLYVNRHRFDRVDQTEILGAVLWLESHKHQLDGSDRSRFENEMRQLPTGVSDQLVRLGFLTFLG